MKLLHLLQLTMVGKTDKNSDLEPEAWRLFYLRRCSGGGGGGSSARVNARAEKLEIQPGAENELEHSLNGRNRVRGWNKKPAGK